MAAPENSTGKTTAPSKNFFITVFFMLYPFFRKTSIQIESSLVVQSLCNTFAQYVCAIPHGPTPHIGRHIIFSMAIITHPRFDYVFIWLSLSNHVVAYGMNTG